MYSLEQVRHVADRMVQALDTVAEARGVHWLKAGGEGTLCKEGMPGEGG